MAWAEQYPELGVRCHKNAKCRVLWCWGIMRINSSV
jgi:hypothetical protein